MAREYSSTRSLLVENSHTGACNIVGLGPSSSLINPQLTNFMIIFIIIGILLGAVAVIFALQNTVAITVTFLFWQIHSSLAIILMVAIISGMIVNLLLSLPEIVSDYFSFKSMIKERNRLEAEVKSNHATIAELNQKVESMARDLYKL
ncbi:MAG: hypothetical protein JWP09_206 [Candidatus Taylorbacteria bacterium]|nr:hypothetical protein [Candidatus Taylorbacteria bacterium]